MEELDLLKKDWNKEQYPKVSENEIYKLMLKNSSSTVKWIFIISVLELSLGILLNVFLSFTKFDHDNTDLLKKYGIYGYNQAFVVFLYLVVVYFIIRFYLMYKKVSTTDNTKQLMDSILKTRKVVKNYILFNLVSIAIYFVVLFSYIFKMELNKTVVDKANINHVYLFSILLAIVFALITLIAIWLFYKLLYGFLLKKLKVNYEELKKVDL
jgi:hypothetical protein